MTRRLGAQTPRSIRAPDVEAVLRVLVDEGALQASVLDALRNLRIERAIEVQAQINRDALEADLRGAVADAEQALANFGFGTVFERALFGPGVGFLARGLRRELAAAQAELDEFERQQLIRQRQAEAERGFFDPETLTARLNAELTQARPEALDRRIIRSIADVYEEGGAEAATEWLQAYRDAVASAGGDSQQVLAVQREFIERLNVATGEVEVQPITFPVVPEIAEPDPTQSRVFVEAARLSGRLSGDVLGITMVDQIAEQIESDRTRDNFIEAFQTVVGELPAALDVANIAAADPETVAGVANTYRALDDATNEQARRIEVAWARAFRSTGDAAARAFSRIVFDGESATDALRSVVRAFVDETLRQLARIAVFEFLDFLGIGDVLNFGGRGDRRQFGGFVGAGRPYVVGEEGPELFVPNTSGDILRAGAFADQPVAVTVNMTVQAGNEVEWDNNLRQRLPDITEAVQLALQEARSG